MSRIPMVVKVLGDFSNDYVVDSAVTGCNMK